MSGTGAYVPSRGGRSMQSPAIAGRKYRDHLRIWWRELDKGMLFLILLLMALGTVAVAAAAPAASEQLDRRGIEVAEFHYLRQHIMFQALGIVGMLGVSMLDRDSARRLGILAFAGFLLLLFLVPVIGVEKNGARRWLEFGMSLQPSEFLKPGFAIVLAWILSWKLRDQNLPVLTFVTAIMALIAGLLMLQPNLGATILFGGIWFVLVLLAGVSIQRIGALIGGGLVALTATYFLYDNARYRIDSFFGGGTAFDQVDLAQRTLLAGGWTGSGLWLGIRKMNLPEPHTDYIFSVIGEEFGLLMCGLIVLLYLAIIGKALMRLVDEDNLFALLAGAGLVTQIGGQAFINILVNLQLFPSKGMTLPLISYGGSSTLAVCFTVGLLLAITRRNPFLERESSGLRDLFERPRNESREERT
ncbi:FtsW/RodA/SpoVE family cell cycle protein [Erythrobacter sp. GH1-10]|uniref:FtsW/RodA/SpoVE family cell cycle protein n=1 Tax=Erythrobacter sp. GH1-10 TaxID=3349334 RepID=UPI0038783321